MDSLAAPGADLRAGLDEPAPAKINLALHVVGRRPDGYHALESLVVFAAHGDRLRIAASTEDRLVLSGPFARQIPGGPDNLVMQALDLARTVATDFGSHVPPLRIELEKSLPPASGIGGGSADAAALLRALSRRWPAERRAGLRAASLRLGADVPMCFDGCAARVSGIGEIAEPAACMPALPMLLVNPGVPVSTPAVFGALGRRDNPPLGRLPADGFANAGTLLAALAASRNDLEVPAMALAPAIGEALAQLRERGALFARMSGSGATAFAIFSDDAACRAAAASLAADRPSWWVLPTVVPATGEPA
ncbi:4-(cytidine 5'-diphospho)-2-C-methyl-D-erythritol kinase [Aureimonas pseudogalii]|uniref:4-diphosphocytidyl-2-C-methyl-D-erythritol kinase n=1 Tax=Aureimonas pseudogalii TaxID=1744844 RepID=A0A7W6EDY9_9HYPH|nr:4-(cytidine 5'-diphospho)-2-C-methyl-D-erythritol kinase [Aureimonas pseudogalii]MBB3996448.1 4-diphosphocytidyl-2-C-methyl-D-erythritol kinase [Aureimonas pseudogalii]